MFYLYTSNQLERLAQQYSTSVNSRYLNVLTSECVVVQNAGMARWLSMQEANNTGISANTDFLFPAEFMWKLLRMVSSDVAEVNQCAPENLRFYIMSELSEHYSRYPELHHYILTTTQSEAEPVLDEVKTWELSCQIALLLDQYLFYRSDWIRDWESNNWQTKDNWQSRLWQACIKDKGLIHWLALQDQFKHSFKNIDATKLPTRISFFSMSALSPGYLDLLGELAKKTDVYFYIINPCEDIYWGDIVSEKSKARFTAEQQYYLDVGNPLLSSMGKQVRDFIDSLQLLAGEQQSFSEFVDENHESKNLLNQLQSDIHQLKQAELLSLQSDNSIRVNSCHTAMREVEVLHDQLLAEFDSDNQLCPSDIVVMMPDVDLYSPYIEAVFSSSSQQLPFSIADQNSQQIFQLIEAIDKLFALQDSRFDVESVFELLEYTDIYEKFELQPNDVLTCRELAKSTNIRWGISSEQRAAAGLPNTEEHTWKYALDRALLGYAISDTHSNEFSHPAEHGQLFTSERKGLSLLPYTEIEGTNTLLLSHLKQFTDAVFKLSYWQQQTCLLQDWIKKSKKLIKQLTTESIEQQKILEAISKTNQEAITSDFSQEISFAVFHKILQTCLQGITANEKYLGYGITFCALTPMRSIPFKIVALLGMNDGEYPRQDSQHSFDLMAKKPRLGDRSRRDEDRYLFLESILAVHNKLIISYTGQNVKDNTELPPSVLVSELLDNVSVYTGEQPEEIIIKHPLQAFSPRYFSVNKDKSSQPLFSYAKEYAKLKKCKQTPSEIFIESPLEELDASFKNITLTELINFFKSPARAFLKQRFAIQTFDNNVTLDIREPFELESFKNREIRNLVLESNVEDSGKQMIARAKGLLPYGQIGDEIYQKEKQITQSFMLGLPENTLNSEKLSEQFNLTLGDFTLHGQLSQLTEEGQAILQVNKPYATDYISLWINHLALNIVMNEKDKKITQFYSPEIKFQINPIEHAEDKLINLIHYYWQGLHFPLQFFPKTSLQLYINNGDQNISKSSDKWNGNDRFPGEKEKFENWLLHRTLVISKDEAPEQFLAIGEGFFGSLFEHYEENCYRT